MTRKRRALSVLALIAVAGVIGARVAVVDSRLGCRVDDGNSDGLSGCAGARVAGPVMSTPERRPLSAQPPTPFMEHA